MLGPAVSSEVHLRGLLETYLRSLSFTQRTDKLHREKSLSERNPPKIEWPSASYSVLGGCSSMRVVVVDCKQ